MKGKDIQEGTVFGTKRVREVLSRGRVIVFTYDYLVSVNDRVRWHRQHCPPVDAVYSKPGKKKE